MKTEPNAPAFAAADASGIVSDGLTKREYFAAAALQGLLQSTPPSEDQGPKADGRAAVEFADFLIAALNEEPPAPTRDVNLDLLRVCDRLLNRAEALKVPSKIEIEEARQAISAAMKAGKP